MLVTGKSDEYIRYIYIYVRDWLINTVFVNVRYNSFPYYQVFIKGIDGFPFTGDEHTI